MAIPACLSSCRRYQRAENDGGLDLRSDYGSGVGAQTALRQQMPGLERSEYPPKEDGGDKASIVRLRGLK